MTAEPLDTPWSRPRPSRAPGYQSLGRVCETSGLTARAVRYYEKLGLLRTRRNGKNERLFDHDAAMRLRLIAGLRLAGLSVADIRDLLEARDRGEADAFASLAARKLANELRDLDRRRAEVKAAFDALIASPPPVQPRRTPTLVIHSSDFPEAEAPARLAPRKS